jgi:hypothetical protein
VTTKHSLHDRWCPFVVLHAPFYAHDLQKQTGMAPGGYDVMYQVAPHQGSSTSCGLGKKRKFCSIHVRLSFDYNGVCQEYLSYTLLYSALFGSKIKRKGKKNERYDHHHGNQTDAGSHRGDNNLQKKKSLQTLLTRTIG